MIGVDAGRLAPGTPVDRLSPNVLAKAIVLGQAQILRCSQPNTASTSLHSRSRSAKAADRNLTINASVLQGQTSAFEVLKQTTVSVVGALTVPIYQGGAEYSAIRQSKETLGQQRLSLDINRDQARATVAQSWGQLDAAKAQIEATTAQVNAAEIALNGVREEARVGQRTTLDVLNAQQELVNARVALVTAQHDRVVASYTLLAAVGGLSMPRLGLNALIDDPMVTIDKSVTPGSACAIPTADKLVDCV